MTHPSDSLAFIHRRGTTYTVPIDAGRAARGIAADRHIHQHEESDMTFDPFTNRIPFGLLTEEEQAALQAQGPWECHVQARGWVDAPAKPGWYNDTIYRRAPLPVDGIYIPPGILAELDPRITCFAADEDRSVWGYDCGPSLLSNIWGVGANLIINLSSTFPAVRPGNKPWRESLVTRAELEFRK